LGKILMHEPPSGVANGRNVKTQAYCGQGIDEADS